MLNNLETFSKEVVGFETPSGTIYALMNLRPGSSPYRVWDVDRKEFVLVDSQAIMFSTSFFDIDGAWPVGAR